MSVSGTVLDLGVDGNVWSGSNGLDSSWSSGGLSDNSVTVLDADSDSSRLNSAVTQSDNLSGDLVNWWDWQLELGKQEQPVEQWKLPELGQQAQQ